MIATPTEYVARIAHAMLARVIRTAEVVEVAPVDGLVRVRFEDSEEQPESPWIPWATTSAGANTWQWSPPEVGARVAVFSPGGDVEAGFVLGAFPDLANAPGSDDGQQTIKIGGLTITVKGNGDVTIDAAGSLTINGAGVTVDAGTANAVVKGLKVELNP